MRKTWCISLPSSRLTYAPATFLGHQYLCRYIRSCHHTARHRRTTRSTHYFLNSSNFATFQTDLNAMGVSGRFCQNIFDYTFSQLSGSLVLFHYQFNPQPRFYVFTIRKEWVQANPFSWHPRNSLRRCVTWSARLAGNVTQKTRPDPSAFTPPKLTTRQRTGRAPKGRSYLIAVDYFALQNSLHTL